MTHRLTEYLIVSKSRGKEVISCRNCRHSFGEATANPKKRAVVKEFPLPKLGTLFRESQRFIRREFYCPGCGTMFDVEINLKGSPYIWDARLNGAI